MRIKVRLHATNVLLVFGFAALGGSLVLPHLTAERVARIEGRADEIVTFLSEIAAKVGVVDGTPGTAAAEALLQEARHAGADLGHPSTWLLEPLPAAAGHDRLGFVCKHYLFLVARTPPPLGSPIDTPLPERSLEVWGWPRSEDGGGRSVFQVRGGATWYCRNLNGRYVGEERVPTPGMGQPRKADADGWYWGLDGERWLARRTTR